ncbi:MAG: hypothetical protein DRI90_24770, partial [Deltaproteobacteria bacterium]
MTTTHHLVPAYRWATALLPATRLCGLLAAALVLLLVAGDGQASDGQASDARELYRQGVVLYDSGHYGAAEEKFEQALALSMAHDIAVSLGQAEEKQDKLDEAADHYLAGLQALPASTGAEVLDKVKRTYERAAAQVGKLEVDTTAGAALWIDGQERTRANGDGKATIHLTAGEHQVRAVAGAGEASVSVSLEAGARQRIELVPGQGSGNTNHEPESVHPHPAVWIAGAALSLGGIGAGIALAVAA